MKLGIDIGSVSAKVVVMDEADSIVASRYVRTKGQPVETVLAVLEEILAEYPAASFSVTLEVELGMKSLLRR